MNPKMPKRSSNLSHMTITPAKNGGFTVAHHLAPKATYRRGMNGGFGVQYAPGPEEHAFGPAQHTEMIAHIARTLGLSDAPEEQAEAEAKAKQVGKRGTFNLGKPGASEELKSEDEYESNA